MINERLSLSDWTKEFLRHSNAKDWKLSHIRELNAWAHNLALIGMNIEDGKTEAEKHNNGKFSLFLFKVPGTTGNTISNLVDNG